MLHDQHRIPGMTSVDRGAKKGRKCCERKGSAKTNTSQRIYPPETLIRSRPLPLPCGPPLPSRRCPWRLAVSDWNPAPPGQGLGTFSSFEVAVGQVQALIQKVAQYDKRTCIPANGKQPTPIRIHAGAPCSDGCRYPDEHHLQPFQRGGVCRNTSQSPCAGFGRIRRRSAALLQVIWIMGFGPDGIGPC
jgi:hypothetical protein